MRRDGAAGRWVCLNSGGHVADGGSRAEVDCFGRCSVANLNAAELDSLPDLVLEDGDRLFVPFRPATVSVIGSVYNSNAFVFRAGKTVSDYLRLSGGVTRNGDKKRSFVIRANGSTISNQQHTGFIVNNFNNLRLMPGDTIVVPENLYKGAFIRGLRDWSQIFTQFALGAAAVQVLLP